MPTKATRADWSDKTPDEILKMYVSSDQLFEDALSESLSTRYSGDEFCKKIQDGEAKQEQNLENALIQYYSSGKNMFYVGRIRNFKIEGSGKYATFLLAPCLHSETEVNDRDVLKVFNSMTNMVWGANPKCGHTFPEKDSKCHIKIYSI